MLLKKTLLTRYAVLVACMMHGAQQVEQAYKRKELSAQDIEILKETAQYWPEMCAASKVTALIADMQGFTKDLSTFLECIAQQKVPLTRALDVALVENSNIDEKWAEICIFDTLRLPIPPIEWRQCGLDQQHYKTLELVRAFASNMKIARQYIGLIEECDKSLFITPAEQEFSQALKVVQATITISTFNLFNAALADLIAVQDLLSESVINEKGKINPKIGSYLRLMQLIEGEDPLAGKSRLSLHVACSEDGLYQYYEPTKLVCNALTVYTRVLNGYLERPIPPELCIGVGYARQLQKKA